MKAFHVLIPARLESQRLPNKPLLDVAGLPLIVRVWQQACQSQAASVHVATDSEAIAEAVRSHGGDVVMTEHDHDSGTARIAEAAAHMDVPEAAIIVNLQGDEPAMPPACIDQVAVLLDASHAAPMATLWLPIHEPAAFVDANTVKLVCDAAGRALYFSRAPIPVRRQAPQATDWGRRHVGLYAYRANALKQWRALPASSLAQAESLEQLRALEAGWSIVCAEAVQPIPAGVDTEQDLRAMRRFFESGKGSSTEGRHAH